MKLPRLLSLLFLALFSLSACSDSDTFAFSALLGEFGGSWDVRYNFDVDDCGIAEQGVVGFVDLQTVEQSGATVTLDSSIGFGSTLSGDVAANNSFVATQTISGDIYGDGIFCVLEQSISYEPTDDNSASTLFRRDLSCADGYFCQSTAVGSGTRR